jgi:hyperosmotically inducible protein
MKVTVLGIAAVAGALALAACERTENPPNTSGPRTTTPPADRRDRSTAPPATRPAPDKDADNTAQNKRDRDRDTTTPMDQGQDKEAIRITADIRKALLDDRGLSTNAHNVKVITDNSGVVTLRGVVESQAEKDAIETKATSVAGVARVINELEVKTGG